MTENISTNSQVTESKDSWGFWVFFGLWSVSIVYLLSIQSSVNSQPDSIFWGYQGLRRLGNVTGAVRFFLLLKAVGVIGGAISLSLYAYRISGKKITYALVGLLSLLSPLLGVVGYFFVRMTSKN